MKKFYLLINLAVIGLSFGSAMASETHLYVKGNNAASSVSERKELMTEFKSNVLAKTYPMHAASEDAPITELPEGAVEKLYTASGVGYYAMWGYIFPNEYEGMAARIAFGPGDEVYIYNPFSSFLTETWLKGTLVDGEIKMEFPQLIYRQDYGDGLVSDFYAMRMIHVPSDEDDGTFIVDPDSQMISYFPDGDAYIMDLDDLGETILGMAWLDPSTNELVWNGNGDYGVNYELFTFSLVTPPANLETEQWAFSNSWGEGHLSNVGFDGDDVFVQGISSYFPDSWIKGNVDGDNVIFPTPQYVGIDDVVGVYDFFCSTEGYIIKDWESGWEEPVLEMTDMALFSYDKENKSMSSDNVLLINDGWEYVYYLEAYTDPLLKYQPEDISLMPAAPSIVGLDPYNPNWGSGSVECFVPELNDDRFVLDTENLYFRIYINRELYEFTPEDYFVLDEPITDIPVNFESFSFYKFGNVHTVTLYIDGIDSIGVQSVYIDGEKEYATSIYYYGESGVDVNSYDRISSVSYFNLQGQRVEAGCTGVVLKVVRYENGEVKTFKIFNK